MKKVTQKAQTKSQNKESQKILKILRLKRKIKKHPEEKPREEAPRNLMTLNPNPREDRHRKVVLRIKRKAAKKSKTLVMLRPRPQSVSI